MKEKKIGGRRHVLIKCAYSGEMFWKDKSEYNRRIKFNKNYKFYKDLKAKADAFGEAGYEHLKPWQGKFASNLKSGGERDEYSPFRYFIKRAKKLKNQKKYRPELQEFDIDLEFLFKLWETQDGICPYTGLKMDLPPTIDHKRRDPACASLDRIDPNKGYMKGNVQFVTQFVNFGKNSYSEEEVKFFFHRIGLGK